MNCQDFSNNGIFNNVPDKPAYAFNEECLNFEQSQGFKWFNIPTENINKKLFLRTIFYSPAGEKYFLRRGCYNNTAFVSPNYIIAPGPTESQITLDYTKEKFPIDSINALLEKVSGVGGQKVCISQDQNKINFWWNPQAINRELENKTTYGNTYDIGNLVTNDSWLCATTQ
jgi:hypothetical protein